VSSGRPAGEIDLSVSCYERTYRSVLTPGFFPTAEADNRHSFARRTVIINNVDDREDAEGRARALRDRGELDAWFFVEDHIDGALRVTGVSMAEIARAPHFTDWALVLATVPGPEWIFYWDAEVRMQEPCDWVTPSIELMERDRRVMIANPRWYAPPGEDTLVRSTVEWADDFALGLGFSDQVFLCRRAELAAPIYGERCTAMRRYPMANVVPVFEARVDAWMRHHGRLRATFLRCTYVHPTDGGSAYPAFTSREKALAVLNRAIIAGVRVSPLKRGCCRDL